MNSLSLLWAEGLLISLFVTLCISLSYVIIRHQSWGEKVLLGPPLLFFIFQAVFVSIGALCLYLNHDFLLHVLDNTTLNSALRSYAIDMNLGLLIFSMGVYSASYFKKFKPKNEITKFQKTNIPSPLREEKVSVYILIFCSTGGLLLFYTFASKVPLLEAISNIVLGEDSHLSALRTEVNHETGTPAIITQLARSIYPVLLAYLWFLWLKQKNWSGLIVNIFCSGLAAFALLANGERSPLLLIILFIFVFYNHYSKYRLSKFFISLSSLFILLVFIGQTFLLGRAGKFESFREAFSGYTEEIFYRLFITQSQTGSYIYQIFPHRESFRGLQLYIQNLKTYLPTDTVSFSVDLFRMVHDRVGSASHSGMAEAYASFGHIGVIIFSFLMGFFLQQIYIHYIRGPKTILRCVSYSFASLVLAMPAIGSVTGLLYGGLAALLLIYILLYSVQGFVSYTQKE